MEPQSRSAEDLSGVAYSKPALRQLSLPIGFMISDPSILSKAAWIFIWENFNEVCPEPNYWTFYAKHEGAQRFIRDLKAQGYEITLIEGEG